MKYEIRVDGAELSGMLAELAKAFRRKKLSNIKEPVILRLVGGRLHAEISGLDKSVNANGDWPTEVQVAASFFIGLGRSPLPVNAMAMSVENGRIRVGPIAIDCSVVESE